jgi:ABC-type bacteriocin/lantibiotic exporter with double-glycine peptidase domain
MINGPHLNLRNYRQWDHHNCGFVAALTIARYFSLQVDAEDVLRAVRIDTPEGWGADADALRGGLEELGIAVDHRQDLTIGGLRHYVERGTPIIVSVWPADWEGDHWVIVQGFDDERVYLTNHYSLTIAEFLQEWSDMDTQGERGNSQEGFVCTWMGGSTSYERGRP